MHVCVCVVNYADMRYAFPFMMKELPSYSVFLDLTLGDGSDELSRNVANYVFSLVQWATVMQ